MTGQHVLNYKIVALIGEGGMGDVYLGEHLSIQRKVAIKVLKPELAKNEAIKSRFKHEASILAQLHHPHIVGLIDYQELNDNLFLIMEYVEGKGLDEIIRSLKSPIELERAKKLMIKTLSAFAYAHSNGIVHRDVKPSNILITPNDDIKVLDFGIAKMIGENQMSFTRTGTQIGTVYYMSPEQVKAQTIDQRSDIYSLGVTFYELLAGFCPYRSLTSEYEIFNKIVQEPLIPLNHSLGDNYEQVWKIIEKATQKDVKNRIQSCSEFSTLLEETEGRTEQYQTQPLSNQNSNGPSSLKIVLFSLLGVSVLVLAFLLLQSKDNEIATNNPTTENSAQNVSESTNNEETVDKTDEEEQSADEYDFSNQIEGFFEAEKSRDLNLIFSYYSPYIRRYYNFEYPSKEKLRNEYEASWRKTSFAANENPTIEKIDDFTYDVNVTYRFVMRSSGTEKSVRSRLHFVFDSDGEILEIYNNN
jgi:serine/threonine protein kinase